MLFIGPLQRDSYTDSSDTDSSEALATGSEEKLVREWLCVSLSSLWQVSLPFLLRLSERAKRASEGITWPTRYLLML